MRTPARIVRFAADHDLVVPLGAVLALMWANTSAESYFTFALSWSWAVNNLGMTLFFALVTQEIVEATMHGGVLGRWRGAMLPVIAAMGGLLGSVLLYFGYLRYVGEVMLSRAAWPCAGAVDLVFSYFLAKAIFRHGAGVAFTLLMAVASDIAVLALVVRYPFAQAQLAGAIVIALAVSLAFLFRRARVRTFWPYLLICGPISWWGFVWTGLQPALALIPIVPFVPHSRRNLELFADSPQSVHRSVTHLEHTLQYPVQAILFLFMLVNSGIVFDYFEPGTWALPLAALVGRPIGALMAVSLALTAGGFAMSLRSGWRDVLVAGFITSTGFSFALFVANAILPVGALLTQMRMGALATVLGSVLAVAAAAILHVGRFMNLEPRPLRKETGKERGKDRRKDRRKESPMRSGSWKVLMLVALASGPATALAQEPASTTPEATTRQAAIEQAQAEKDGHLQPYVLSEGERVANRAEDIILNGLTWHPFFENAYQGGGFPFGLGYKRYVSPHNQIDVRGSYTVSGYKRAEAEFVAPHLFDRRGVLSLVGGWREATEVGFYGFGPDSLQADRTSYAFRQPYAQATLTLRPTRRHWLLQGGTEWTEWQENPGQGSFPSVDTIFTPETLPGLNADVTYIHSQAATGFDWRPSPGYARRGGYYGVTVHDYTDTSGDFGFNQIDYEAIQHFPILRESWAITLRGRVQTAFPKGDQQIPFFMLPSLGGGSTLRGFSSWRFRDRNSLLLQAEWRVMANRFFDTAFFYDTGKVAARTPDLDFKGLQDDYGVGFRFHSVDATILRMDVARSHEGTQLVFAASRVF